MQTEKIEALKEHDYNVFLLNELVEANLVSGELEGLETEYETLNNIEDIKEELSLSSQILSDEQIGILQSISTLKNSLNKLSGISSTYLELYNQIISVSIELDDVIDEIETAQENLEADPGRLDIVNQKLQKIHNLLVKHNAATIDELLEIKSKLDNKVIATENIDDDIANKQKELDAIAEELSALAEQIHNQRERAIPELIKQLESILGNLGMVNAKFNISVNREDEFLSNGKDKLSFLFSANKGGDFKSLKKAASGGELSRIMLAVKSILANFIQLPSIMFDEIDTGVSGEISNRMATIMQQMSSSMQVFTITHLPQIAAKGDTIIKFIKQMLMMKR